MAKERCPKVPVLPSIRISIVFVFVLYYMYVRGAIFPACAITLFFVCLFAVLYLCYIVFLYFCISVFLFFCISVFLFFCILYFSFLMNSRERAGYTSARPPSVCSLGVSHSLDNLSLLLYFPQAIFTRIEVKSICSNLSWFHQKLTWWRCFFI